MGGALDLSAAAASLGHAHFPKDAAGGRENEFARTHEKECVYFPFLALNFLLLPFELRIVVGSSVII